MVSGPRYGRYKLFSRTSHFPTVLPGFTFPPVLLGEPYCYPSAAKASRESETTVLVGGPVAWPDRKGSIDKPLQI